MSITEHGRRTEGPQRLDEGQLGAHLRLYAERLLEEGYCRAGVSRDLRITSDFSHWLSDEGLGLHELDERTVERYQRHRHPSPSDARALRRLLRMLRDIQAIAPLPRAVLDPLEQIEEDFYRYLAQQCGLAHVSVIRHKPVLRQFLGEQRAEGRRSLSRLTAVDVTRFVESHAHDQSPKSAQSMCWSLRSFLRYLLFRGEIFVDLAGSVPAVRTWKLTSIPQYLRPRQIQQVLATCDRRSPIGRRNYAILLLLSRLGLRANEVRLLALEDIDWGAPQLVVQGKGGQRAPLPLPGAVGAAIADYLRYGRPRSGDRRVFLRHVAPHRGFTTSRAISTLAETALGRAGFQGLPRKGAHLFRHSLATQMLRAGASLREIGQVLRHRKQDATRIYAKVDIGALRTLALPWPGGGR